MNPAARLLRGDRTWLVALAASFWGLSGLLRQPLAERLPAPTVVMWEHLILVLVLVPFLGRAVRAYLRAGRRDQVAVAITGIGASALATTLFTLSFKVAAQTGDYVTPVVLQKLQPLMAIGLAVLLLGERLRPKYWLFAVPALVGAWMLTFADPTEIRVAALVSALLAVGAAMLWGAGTVLGRMVSNSFHPVELTTLRFAWGLPAAAVVVALTGSPVAITGEDVPLLLLLALIPGLLSLALYYLALRTTPASRATLAELAFPATAAFVGVVFLGAQLTWSQWVGFALLVSAITAFGRRERQAEPTVSAAEPAPVRR